MIDFKTLDDAVNAGNIKAVKKLLPTATQNEVDVAFYHAVMHEYEDIACYILEQRSSCIGQEVVAETFRSAAAHDEHQLASEMLELCKDKITPNTLLKALHMAMEGCYGDMLTLLAKDERLETIINTENDEYKHPLMIAIDQNNNWLLNMLLQFPGIKVAYHHEVYAEQLKRRNMLEFLKAFKAAEYHKIDKKQFLIRYEKNHAVVGPHLRQEMQRRGKYVIEQGRTRNRPKP